MFKIAVLASTNGTDLQAIIDQIEAGNLPGIEITSVISNKENCGALEKARTHHIPDIFLDPSGKSREQFDQELAEILQTQAVDLVVLIGYMRVLTPEFVRQFPKKIINVHPSLIPKYCGKNFYGQSVHQAVLDNNETETGMTIHYVDEGVDTGEVILQKTCPIFPDDTPATLKARVQELEKKHYPQVIFQLSKQ